MAAGQWWVVSEGILGDLVNDLTQGQLTGVKFTVVQSVAQPSGATGPYATRAQAVAEANALTGDVNKAGNSALPQPVKAESVPSGWQLLASGFSGWFVRGLKVTFGGILLILAVSHLTGASNALTRAIPVATAAVA
jgi:hypothetical protein